MEQATREDGEGAHHRQPGLVPLLREKEVPGSGLGAAAEAHIISQRLYDLGGTNPFARVVVFDPADAQGIPLDLKGYHRFDPASDFAAMIAWNRGAAPAAPPAPPVAGWPVAPPVFEWEPADCEPVREAFTRLLTAGTPDRVLLVRGVSETGKSLLSCHLLGLALGCEWLACGRFDLKSDADLEREFAPFVAHLGVDEKVNATAGQPLRARLDAVLAALRERGRPTLLLFDTFEQGGEWASWVEGHALLAVPRAPWLRLVITGQQVPAWLRPPGPVSLRRSLSCSNSAGRTGITTADAIMRI